MAFDNREQEIAAIGFGMDTPFWREFLLPTMQNRAKAMMEALAAAQSDQDDIKRGWIQALRWVIRMPEHEINEYRKIEQEQAQESRLADLDEHRARVGFRSPYPTPAPGDLTEEESSNG